MRIDLDSDIKLILRYLPIPEIELLKQMTNELKAAREFIKNVKDIEELDSYQRFEPKFFIKIKRLEESK